MTECGDVIFFLEWFCCFGGGKGFVPQGGGLLLCRIENTVVEPSPSLDWVFSPHQMVA